MSLARLAFSMLMFSKPPKPSSLVDARFFRMGKP
jgi:hypothetical protein